jgi:glycosyltransferase involved in cell wall biosynthesis
LPLEEKIGNVFVHRIGYTRKNPSIADLEKLHFKLTKLWYELCASWYAARLHRTYHFDGIWAMMAHSAGVPAGLFKTFHPEVKYLLTLQEGDPPEKIERTMWPLWPLFKRAFTKADALQPISNFLLFWGTHMGFHNSDTQVIPNGVDIPNFSRPIPPGEIVRVRNELGKQEGDVWLVHTGRMVPKNGQASVIFALASLPPHIHFLQIGIGPDEAKLRKLVSTLHLESRVHFMEYVDHANLLPYMQACDIFIRPSLSEGMGNSFIEAMTAGLPVIGTQEGGIADFLFDEKNDPDHETTGWAVPKLSPTAIAAAVNEIIVRPDKVDRVTKTARQMVVVNYDWNLIARRMQKLLEHLTMYSDRETL